MKRVFTSAHHVTMFAKAPVAGKVKTRLAATLGFEVAANLHAAFLADLGGTLERLVQSSDVRSVSASLSLAGDADHPAFVDLIERRGLSARNQGEGGLGERLSLVTTRAFAQGVEQLLIIGSDSPTLAARHFEAAFDALDAGADVVIGPSFDGGYYLIGFRAAHTGVFQDIDWSTREVLGQTLARANQEELDVALLEFWYDVDELEDLLLLRTHLRQHLARMGGGQYSDTRTMLEQLESILD